MTFSPESVAKHFEEMEKIAEAVLSDQQEIVNLNKRTNTNREALRQLKFNSKCKDSKKSWVCISNMFMRLPTKNVINNIENEQTKLDEEINDLRNCLRGKVDALNKLEGKPLSRGSGLKCLSKDEWDAVKQVLGR